MFTPDSLLDLAVALEASAQSQAPLTAARYADHWEMNQAFDTALWMENHGITKTQMIGKYGSLPLKGGMKVRIKRGAEIGSMGARKSPFAGVSYVVSVHHVFDGATFHDMDGTLVVRNQSVHWSGKNGWCWTDATNVEIVALAA